MLRDIKSKKDGARPVRFFVCLFTIENTGI